mgnify:CR=1 FL=1
MHPVEDRHLVERSAGDPQLPDRLDDQLRLLPLVGAGHHADRRALLVLRPELLRLAVHGARDDGVGGPQDALGAPVVLLELDDRGVRELLAEVEDVAPVGASPAVDALVVVADHGHLAVLRGDGPHQPVLHVVGVLELVDEQVPEAPTELDPEALLGLDREHQAVDEVREVERVGLRHALLVLGVDALDLLVEDVADDHVAGAADLLLLPADPVDEELRRVALLVELHVLEHALHHRAAVLVVVDGEVALHADLVGVATQQPRAGRVEGADPEIARPAADEVAEPLPHLLGGLVGEGDGQDVPGRHRPLRHQVRHAVGDDARLAAARAREDHQGPSVVEDRLALRRIQPRQTGIHWIDVHDGRP